MLPLNLAGNAAGSSGATSAPFISLLQAGAAAGGWKNPYDPEKQQLPWAIAEMQRKEDIYNDPDRIRELLGVYKEFRSGEAKEAFDMQMKRDMINMIPRTAEAISTAIYNPDRQRILASIPENITTLYANAPWNPIQRRTAFR